MINDTELNQENNGSGLAYQSAGDMNFYGLSYADTRQLALDLWRDNAVKLSEKAAQTAMSRINEFLDLFLSKLSSKNPELFNTLKEPAMQMVLFCAERDYAKTGDKDLAEVMTNMLASRAEQKERTIEQMTLDKCLTALPNLTQGHIDLLSIVYVLDKYLNNIRDINTHAELSKYLNDFFKPFSGHLRTEQTWIDYLINSECLSSGGYSTEITHRFFHCNTALFRMGIPLSELEKVGPLNWYESLIKPCPHNPGNVQLIEEGDILFSRLSSSIPLNDRPKYWFGPIRDAITNWVDEQQKVVTNAELLITENVLVQLGEFMRLIQNVHMLVNKSILTPVGTAIAKANLSYKIGLE